MRISDSIYIIGGGLAGAGISCDIDCNVYLVDCGGGYVLIDCGCGVETERLAANLTRWGFAPRDCRRILLTHAHADHAAGAAWLAEFTGAPVTALPEAADYLRRGDAEAISLDVAIAAGVYPAGFRFPACPAEAVEDGRRLAEGKVEFTVVATPGHCSGHGCYLATVDGRRTLFAGDAVFPGGGIAVQPIRDCRPVEYAASLARLNELAVEALLPSHHGFAMAGGGDHIARAHDAFRRLAMPANA